MVVGVTQPRRVAAVSLAQRVSEEVGVKLGTKFGYQIRFDAKNYDPKQTQIKFMTDGILLKEIETDFLLRHYSVIIVDEAHERSLNSDILVSLLTRVVQARTELAFKERQRWAREKQQLGVDESQKEISFEYYPLRLVIMSATLRVDDFQSNERLFPPRIFD